MLLFLQNNFRSHYIPLLCALIFLSACSSNLSKEETSQAQQRIEIPFSPVTGWVERRFAGSSNYNISQHNNSILTAYSKSSASLLYKKIHIDLTETPYLNWQWLIEQTYVDNFQEQTKQGDDFPARIYIAIKPSLGQIKPRALTYVWASNSEQFSHWKNPFTKSVEVFAIQSGETLIGKWVTEKRNLKDDLRTFFGQPIDAIEGIGVMTDSDNFKTFGKAAYANLFFSRD